MRCILFVRRDLSLMLLDDCLCHRESYAVATRKLSRLVCAVEAVEQAVEFKLAYCCIGLFYGENSSSSSVEIYGDLAALIALLNGIVHQDADKSVQERFVTKIGDFFIYACGECFASLLCKRFKLAGGIGNKLSKSDIGHI